MEEYGEEVPEEYQPEGIKISVVYKSFAYFSLEVEYPEDPKGYGNAFFVIDGIEAGKETIAEAVEKDCETAFTGSVTLEVKDLSSEGESEQFSFNFKIDKAIETDTECEKMKAEKEAEKEPEKEAEEEAEDY